MAFHQQYVRISTGRLPDNMKPWKNLKTTFQTANLEHAGILSKERHHTALVKLPKVVEHVKELLEEVGKAYAGRLVVEKLSVTGSKKKGDYSEENPPNGPSSPFQDLFRYPGNRGKQGEKKKGENSGHEHGNARKTED